MLDEKKTDPIKTLEGKNVAYYSVVLQTVIQSEIEAVKISITLSSVAIGLLSTVDFSSESFPVFISIIQVACFVLFATSIVAGILFHVSSSDRYAEEIKNEPTNEGQKRLSEARASFKTKKLFALWCFVLGAIGFGIAGVVGIYGTLLSL